MGWRRARAFLVAGPLAVVSLAAMGGGTACDDDDDDDPTPILPASIRINEPDSVPLIVRVPTFDVAGTYEGEPDSIELTIDGVRAGFANTTGGTMWRVPASNVRLDPGMHEIVATITGPDGTAEDRLWVRYETDPAVTFEVAVVPESATYAPGEEAVDPDVLVFGLGLGRGRPPQLDAEAPPQLDVSIERQPSLGQAPLMIDIVDPTPGVHPVVVTATLGNKVHEAVHTITITGPAATTTSATTSSTTEPPALTTTVDPTGTDRVLFDDFEAADRWTTSVILTTNGAADKAEPAGGGNPGGRRRMEHLLPGTADGENNPTQIRVVHLFGGGGWDAANDGPLDRIDYSEDQIQVAPPFDGSAIGTRFVVVQGGTTYLASVNDGNAFTTTSWQTASVRGLTPADFSPEPGPDFSAGGAPMEFGYLRSNTNQSSTGITTQHGIDNWTVKLFGG